MKLIDKDALVAEIESLLDKGRYHEEYDCAYRDGNNGALYALKSKLDTLEVKEVEEAQEEPVSDDLEKAKNEWLTPQLDKSYAAYGETKMMELTRFDGYAMLDAIEFGAKWQKEHLLKPADGDDLPEIDREVIALEGIVDPTATDCFCGYKVVFAHRPATEGYDGKSITTGQIEHYTPKTYDKGGWNIPNIVYWLDVELPKEMKDE